MLSRYRSGAGKQRRAVCWRVVLGIVLFFAIDSAVFRTGFYTRWTAPNSGLGAIIRVVRDIRSIPADKRSILVVGDSRIAEGFSANLATRTAADAGSPLMFTSGGIPGSLPRVWYYLLRQIDHPGRLAAVVLMTTSYHDDDPEPLADRSGDIVFVHPLLMLSDLFYFPWTFSHGEGAWEATKAILFEGYYYKNDVQDFLGNPVQRIRDVVAWRKHGLEWFANYGGRDRSLEGMSLDLGNGALATAPEHPPTQPNTLALYAANLRANRGRFPDNAAAAAYRKEWFGKIADLCQRDGLKLIVFRIPRGPLHHMVDPDEQPTGALAALADSGKLQLLPAATFDHLEWPQFFFDDLHLNHAGRDAFSPELAEAVLPYLRPAK